MASAAQDVIHTPLTSLLGIKTPVIAAPMAGASGGELAAQVTLGGGFGFMSVGYDSAETVTSQLKLARSALNIPEGKPLPIGVGYLVWQFQKDIASAKKLIAIAVEERVQAIWLSFGNNVGEWINIVRSHAHAHNPHHKILMFTQVTSVEEARIAVENWKVDVLVVQGIESGGHGGAHAPPLLSFVPEVLELPWMQKPGSPPLVAAGGLANGSQVASMLALGAAGVVLGTRFLLSPESLYSDAQRNALIAAQGTPTTRTMAFDYARGTLGWPEGIDGRALRNKTVEDYEQGVAIDVLRQKLAEGVRNSDPERMLVWTGTGVTLMRFVLPARDIVRELHLVCVTRLEALVQAVPQLSRAQPTAL